MASAYPMPGDDERTYRLLNPKLASKSLLSPIPLSYVPTEDGRDYRIVPSTMVPETLVPSISFTQDTFESDDAKAIINITVNLSGIIESSLHFRVSEDSVHFAATTEDGNRYSFDCTLYGEVIPEDLKTSLTQKFFSVVLPKAKKDDPWPRLTKHEGELVPPHMNHNAQSVPMTIFDMDQMIANLEHLARILPDDRSDERDNIESYVSHHKSFCAGLGFHMGMNTPILLAMMEHLQRLHPDDTKFLTGLGNSLMKRFGQFSCTSDLDLAIWNFERALNLTPLGNPHQPDYLCHLGSLLETRFDCLGDTSDLQKAISYHERTVQLTPDGHPGKPHRLGRFGCALLTRYDWLGEMVDAEQAISNHKRAVQLTPDGHPDKPMCLNWLGMSFSTRFDHHGEVGDIDQAILNYQHMILLTPDGDPGLPNYLMTIGSTFLRRFGLVGDKEDLDQGILYLNRGVHVTPDDHPSTPTLLTNLAMSFSMRSTMRTERSGQLADMDEALSNYRRALELTPDGEHDKYTRFNNLGLELLTRFNYSGEQKDLEEAINNLERASRLIPVGHPRRPTLLHNFGKSFLSRFHNFEDIGDLEQAILNFELAIKLTQEGHKNKVVCLNSLGDSFLDRFKHSGDNEDLVRAITTYQTCANSAGPPSSRFHAAQMWSQLAQYNQPSGTLILDAFYVAFDLLPRLAWLGLSIDARHRKMVGASSLACHAAAAAIAAGNLQKALEWLEQGRSIIWGQILQLRTPLDELSISNASLAAELARVAAELERGGVRSPSANGGDNGPSDQTPQTHRRFATDWQGLVEQVREIPGFERFMLPKEYSELRNSSRDGPVIVLNISTWRCDALIIVSPSVPLHHVHLESFSYHRAEELRLALHAILSLEGLRERCDGRHGGLELGDGVSVDDVFRGILAELWKSVVKPVLVHLESLHMESFIKDELFRIRWCPTGPLAFLPIHAAGIYFADGTTSISLPDIAISSYTPTLTALLSGNQRPKSPVTESKFLAVIQPNTPGDVSSLPGTVEELKCIQKYTSSLPIRVLDGQEATVEKVLSGMEECSWVHLACHGVQDVSQPMESGLLLHDGRLQLSKIIQKNLLHAEFAFLSACQTATGDEVHPEEAIHLAAGMLLAGYRGVVATMWSISDSDAPFVTDKVYGRLFGDGKPNSSKAAEALHFAIRDLRERNGYGNFASWVPFVYMGV